MDLSYEQQSYKPEWIQCGDCRKWRKRASEYIKAVQAGPWTCDKPGSGCSCQDSCDGCNSAACKCPESDTWEDADDPGKHFIAFGAQTPTDFQHEVKQKPDGTLYVEWNVCCRRCGVNATLDRANESQRDKDRLLSTGKGNARTTECWLRVHQSCNADWSHLMSTSLKFRVPSGYRFFNRSRGRSDTNPDFAPAGPASQQPSLGSSHAEPVSDSPREATATMTHSQAVSAAESAPQQRRASACLSVSAPSSDIEEQADPDFCPNMPINWAVKCKAGSFGLAASQPDALLLVPTASAASPADESPPTAAAAVLLPTGNKTEHSLPSAQAVAVPHKLQSAADPQLVETCFTQASASRVTLSASGHGSKADVLTDAVNQIRYHACQQASEGKAPIDCRPGSLNKGQPSSQQAETTKDSRPLQSISTAPPKWQAVTGSQLQAPSLHPPMAPRGLNGPLLSHPRKRKTPDAAFTASQLQHRLPSKDSFGSAVKSEIIDRVKRVKTETQAERAMSASFDCVDLTQRELQLQHRVSSSSSPDSLDVMFKKVNCFLQDEAISQEQMRLLQGAVDHVDELRGLERDRLTRVLKSIGKLDSFQIIAIRNYLTESQ